MAAQDQSLRTRNYEANIIKNGTNPNCRICDKSTETIDHIVAGCSVLAPTEYTHRHDRVGQYLHWKICQHYGAPHAKTWYEHKPQPVVETKNATILWDFSINTDRTIKANRPDIVVKDHKEETCLLIDMSVPTDKNISAKEFDKKAKYFDLKLEIEKSWQLKTSVIPIVVGALGMITKNLKKYLSQIPGNPCFKEIQKIVLTSTAHTLRRVLSM